MIWSNLSHSDSVNHHVSYPLTADRSTPYLPTLIACAHLVIIFSWSESISLHPSIPGWSTCTSLRFTLPPSNLLYFATIPRVSPSIYLPIPSYRLSHISPSSFPSDPWAPRRYLYFFSSRFLSFTPLPLSLRFSWFLSWAGLGWVWFGLVDAIPYYTSQNLTIPRFSNGFWISIHIHIHIRSTYCPTIPSYPGK